MGWYTKSKSKLSRFSFLFVLPSAVIHITSPWNTKIAANTFYQTIARLASSGTGFLVAILLARYVGVSLYGDFAKVTAYITIFYLFVDFGLNAVFLQQKNNTERFHELLLTRVFLSVGMVLITNLLVFFLPYNSQTAIGFSPAVQAGIHIFSLTLITEAILYTTTVVFQRELSYQFLMIATLIGSFVTLVGVYLSVLYTTSLVLVFVSYIMGGIIESAIALGFAKKTLFTRVLDTEFIKKLFIQTIPVTLMLLFNLIYFRIDTLLLSSLKPSNDVAIYDVAYKFFDFLIAVPLYISNAIYPSLLSQKSAPFKKYLLSFFGISLLIVIPSLLLAPLIGMIKSDFIPAILVLRILVLSLPIFFLTNILQWMLLARKQQRFLAGVYLGVGIINIILNIIYIPQFSFIASAIITGITEGIVLLALIVYIKIFKI